MARYWKVHPEVVVEGVTAFTTERAVVLSEEDKRPNQRQGKSARGSARPGETKKQTVVPPLKVRHNKQAKGSQAPTPRKTKGHKRTKTNKSRQKKHLAKDRSQPRGWPAESLTKTTPNATKPTNVQHGT